MFSTRERTAILRRLIQIPSVNPPGDELPAAQYLHDLFVGAALPATVLPFGDNRANVVARLPGRQSDRCLVFSGHLDVVPLGTAHWEYDPFAAEEIDGRLYGRGAADMKAGTAAMVVAMIELHQEGVVPAHDVLFLGSAGEEAGCVGARHLAHDGYLRDSGGIVISEPTSNNIDYAHKGALWVSIETRGRTAHGSTPHLGINAVEGMLVVLDAVCDTLSGAFGSLENSELGRPTFAITRIAGGVKTNVIPDECRAEIDMRTIPEQDHGEIARRIEEAVKRSADEAGMGWQVDRINDLLGFHTSADNPFLQWVRKVATGVRGEEVGLNTSPGYTDASIYASASDAPVVVLGPGDPDQAHQPNEFVDLAEYWQAVEIYKHLVRSYDGS